MFDIKGLNDCAMPIVLSIYNSISKFQANHTLKITLSQPKLKSQAGNSPHFISQFDLPHLQTKKKSGEHNNTILFSQNNTLKSKNSETALWR